MNIEALVTKYFEGETTCEEERILRQLFANGIVSKQLEVYRPMFAILEEENRAEKEKQQKKVTPLIVPKAKAQWRRALLFSLSGIAAGLLLLLGIAGIHSHFSAKSDNYVIIDGKRYTDAKLIHQQAAAAFEEVSFSEEEALAALFE